MLNKLTPNIMVDDVAQTIEYYREILDFRLDQTVPETAPFDWASMTSGDVELMFQARASLSTDFPAFLSASTGATLTFFIQVDGINNLYARIKNRVNMLQELHDTFYGMREFAFADLNGYILVIAESLG